MNKNLSSSSTPSNLSKFDEYQLEHEAPLVALAGKDVENMSEDELRRYVAQVNEMVQCAQTRTAKVKKGAKATKSGEKVLGLLPSLKGGAE